jgi:3-methyl-2-oxobutanoate hydroxymethyltransferase
MVDRITVPKFAARKRKGRKLVMVTCYDATFARLVDRADIDAVLVGDSLGNVIQGHETTIPVTIEDVIYHTRAVSRGLNHPLLVADLPFMTYQASREEAMFNSGRLMQEGRAHAVKLEGGVRVAETVAAIVETGIPVMGHIGLTPQSVHGFGGYRIQGRGEAAAQRLKDDALALQDAGVFSVVLEGIPTALAAEISASLEIPTIGIGAGPNCDGQVLVLYDLLGLDESFAPRFVKQYATLSNTVGEALESFAHEVRDGKFPAEEHSFD